MSSGIVSKSDLEREFYLRSILSGIDLNLNSLRLNFLRMAQAHSTNEPYRLGESMDDLIPSDQSINEFLFLDPSFFISLWKNHGNLLKTKTTYAAEKAMEYSLRKDYVDKESMKIPFYPNLETAIRLIDLQDENKYKLIHIPPDKLITLKKARLYNRMIVDGKTPQDPNWYINGINQASRGLEETIIKDIADATYMLLSENHKFPLEDKRLSYRH